MALSSDTLKALLAAGGAGIEALGNGLESSANRKLTKAQIIANYLQGERTNQSNAGLQSAALLGGGPYETANDLQKQLTKRALLAGAQNVSVNPSDTIAPYVGHVNGGLRIPEGGLDLSALSDPALAESAKSYYTAAAQANPLLKVPNLGTLGLGQSGTDATNAIGSAQSGFLQDDQAKQKAIMEYLDPHKASGGGFWHKFGQALKIAGPIATSFIPGVGPVLGGLLAAGTSAGGDLLAGGDWKSALVSGALAGGGSALAPKSIFKIPTKDINRSMQL